MLEVLVCAIFILTTIDDSDEVDKFCVSFVGHAGF